MIGFSISTYLKIALILLGLSLFDISAQAQEKPFSTSLTLGATTPILDNGIGFHLGVNPAFRLAPILSVEGQFSYLFTAVNSSFLSGNEGNNNAVNTLAGLRLYLNPEDKPNRFYFNFLLGAFYNRESVNGAAREGEFGTGFSIGAYAKLKQVLIGLSYDTPQNIVLKAGYVF